MGQKTNYLTFLAQDILGFGNPSTPPRVDPSRRLRSLAPAANSILPGMPVPSIHVRVSMLGKFTIINPWPSRPHMSQEAFHAPTADHGLSPTASVGVLTGSIYLGVNCS
ncbi:unnamed protein product [Rangifer tarandus platyrhynchus]|uniref:Uncharacterized protein n=2 Tax=Rangifer tarandus platyrhynchus TaxID=3082113 RepID=A0ABN8YN98_RANTA|nr:unnamed protein product [Rangifer tarandus platyrhynchus]